MTGLLIMIVCCTVFSLISQKRSESIRGHRSSSRERIFFTIILCYTIVFSGLRVSYNDTYAYIQGFNSALEFPEVLSHFDWNLGSNPGFRIFVSIIRTFTDNSNLYLMICSAITLGITLWFVRKYTKSFVLALFLFFMMGYYTFTMAAVKQTLTTALALIAVDKLIKNKKLSFVFILLIGATFHPYCLMYFCIPLLLKQVPWKKGTWILIICVSGISYAFNFLPEALVNITEYFGESYGQEMFVGEGINAFRVMVYFTPVAISFIWRKILFINSTQKENLFVNCTIVCAMIMFIGLFGNANTFARLAMYFEPMIYIALPWMLYKLKARMAGFVIGTGCYTAFPLYFCYQMVIASTFDQAFSSISLWQFFESFF
ncbi:MAG: EpsG family protein [Ruminococcaceae bacterium]|nr:EpsG family protein [Oscillospiraceae bacterium]